MDYDNNSLKDLKLKIAYESKKDDLLSDFYIPALTCAYRYDRISGFFSSTALAIAARGIAGLIRNKGKMRLITCQRFSPADVKMIESCEKKTEELLAENFITEYSQIEEQFQKDHIQALGWMLQHGYLEMKIALVYKQGHLCTLREIDDSAILHQKVGILYDNTFNAISFSGSNNESATGWLDNIEEFKVFKNWIPEQKLYFRQDENKFDQFWNNRLMGVKVIDLPVAVKNNLISVSKDFEIDKIALKKYYHRITDSDICKERLSLFGFQKEAVETWDENNKRLILEMATGTGKTRTAIGCINRVIKKKILIVVACPQSTLSRQWEADINTLDIPIDKSLFIDGSVSKWDQKLYSNILQLKVGRYSNLLIYVTHSLACDKKFISKINSIDESIICFFIADEAHLFGAGKRRNALLDRYNYRLALSATPQRWFDDEGSKIIIEYFGKKSYVFSLGMALQTINPLTGYPFLTNYYYYPCFIELTSEELEKYNSLTKKLHKISYKKSNDETKIHIRERLAFLRADITKNAEEKYTKLKEILDKIHGDLKDTIIFVSPEQLDEVLVILNEKDIRAHKFTEAEGTKKESRYGGISEREFIVKHFANKDYQILVAIKCLDEGIDIPSARRAIIMASSTNPREYVQRIGRIIRRDNRNHKCVAEIYDMVVKPSLLTYDENEKRVEKEIFQKEMNRIVDISRNALNNATVSTLSYEILREVNQS